MSTPNFAQDRADAIKARRLAAVTTRLCGYFRDGWVCVSVSHPQVPDQHYFVKERPL